MIIMLPWKTAEKDCLCLDALHGGMISYLVHPLYLFTGNFKKLREYLGQK